VLLALVADTRPSVIAHSRKGGLNLKKSKNKDTHIDLLASVRMLPP